MAARAALQSISCYHCSHAFEVGTRTASTNCPECNQRLVVEDVIIKQLTPVSRVQTCGRLRVSKKGSVIAEFVQAAGGVEVLGSLDARVESGGPVVIGPAARWKGDCRAPSVAIQGGANIQGGFEVSPANAEPAQTDSDEDPEPPTDADPIAGA